MNIIYRIKPDTNEYIIKELLKNELIDGVEVDLVPGGYYQRLYFSLLNEGLINEITKYKPELLIHFHYHKPLTMNEESAIQSYLDIVKLATSGIILNSSNVSLLTKLRNVKTAINYYDIIHYDYVNRCYKEAKTTVAQDLYDFVHTLEDYPVTYEIHHHAFLDVILKKLCLGKNIIIDYPDSTYLSNNQNRSILDFVDTEKVKVIAHDSEVIKTLKKRYK